MSAVYSLGKQPGSNTSQTISVPVIDKNILSTNGAIQNQQKNGFRTDYVYADGLNDQPLLTASSAFAFQNATRAILNYGIVIPVLSTDGSILTWVDPIEVNIQVRANPLYSGTLVNAGFWNGVSLTYNTVTAGVTDGGARWGKLLQRTSSVVK